MRPIRPIVCGVFVLVFANLFFLHDLRAQEIVFPAPCDSFGIFDYPSQPAKIKNNLQQLDSLLNETVQRLPGDREVTAYYHYLFYVDCQGRFVASTMETYDGMLDMASRILKRLNKIIVWVPARQNDLPVNTIVRIKATVRKGKISILQ